jgi:hypothetical protein
LLQKMSIFSYTFNANMYCCIYSLKFKVRQQLPNREKWSTICEFTETD